MRRYGISAAIIAGLYAVNQVWLSDLHPLLDWYFADFLAGGLMLCILNAALQAAKKPPVRRLRTAAAFSLVCGLFWEYVTPLYLARSVSDPWDVAAVTLGGITMWLILHKKSPPR